VETVNGNQPDCLGVSPERKENMGAVFEHGSLKRNTHTDIYYNRIQSN